MWPGCLFEPALSRDNHQLTIINHTLPSWVKTIEPFTCFDSGDGDSISFGFIFRAKMQPYVKTTCLQRNIHNEGGVMRSILMVILCKADLPPHEGSTPKITSSWWANNYCLSQSNNSNNRWWYWWWSNILNKGFLFLTESKGIIRTRAIGLVVRDSCYYQQNGLITVGWLSPIDAL